DEKFFSDGSPLGAEHVVSSLTNSIRDLGEDSRWAFGNIIGFSEFIKNNKLMKVKGIYHTGNSKVVFEFEHPTPYFIKILTGPYFSIYKKASKIIIGSGPYKFKYMKKEGVYLERNSIYKAKFEGPSRLLFTSNKPTDEDINLTRETKNKDLLKENFPYLQSVILIFNTLDPQFMDPQSRCAFAQEATLVFGQSAYNFTPVNIGLPLSWSIKRPIDTNTKNDLKNFKNKTIEIVFTNSTAYFDEEKHTEIAKVLEKNGLKVTFKKLNTHEFIESMKINNFKIALVGFVPDYVHPDAILTPLLGTNQQFNFSKYSNLILDKILIDAKSSEDRPKQLELYNKAFQILSSECPVVFLGSQAGQLYRKKNLYIPSFSSLGFHNIDFSKVSGVNN
nr:ABC transporter substrate-binding protein [Pseudobdellovibrionaceae bacterium]